jgi:threonine dehydratase
MILPTFDDVADAAKQIAGAAHRTPVATSRSVNARTEAEVFFKCESLQRAGAFKTTDERRRGIVAFSSGNHAQAVALAGQILGVPRTIVMPTDAPAVKRQATAGYGGDIVLYDREHEDREAIGRQLARERGLSVIPPYDHPHIVAGAGTAALELLQEAGDLDLLLVPCGGGGLLGGSALAVSGLCPTCRVVGVEPAAGDDATRSFRSGRIETVSNPQTVADGARTTSLGAVTFPLMREHVSDMVTVDDAALLRTMFYLWERLKLVIEPTGALGAAAAIEDVIPIARRRVGVILSGGNIDVSQVAAWIARR